MLDTQAVSHVLGLLINLVEDSAQNRQLLASFAFGQGDGAGASTAAPLGIVWMLCQLIALSPGCAQKHLIVLTQKRQDLCI